MFRRLITVTAVVAAAVTFGLTSAHAAVSWNVGSALFTHWVEQQASSDCNPNPYPGTGTLCPWNNIGLDGFHGGAWCTWNYNDFQGVSVDPNGSLSGHTSTSYTLCDVAEGFTSPNASCNTGCGNPMSVSFTAASNTLTVQYCSVASIGGSSRCWTLSPVYQPASHNYSYFLCEREVYDYGTWEYAIQDSFGGVGVITDLTVTLTNPTGQKISKINGFMASVGIGQQAPGCNYSDSSANVAAPYRWSP